MSEVTLIPEDEIPPTGDPRVDAALQRIRGKFPNLEDAVRLQDSLAKVAAERIRTHELFKAEHARNESECLRSIATHNAIMIRIEKSLAEMTRKVNFLIARDREREGGAGA